MSNGVAPSATNTQLSTEKRLSSMIEQKKNNRGEKNS